MHTARVLAVTGGLLTSAAGAVLAYRWQVRPWVLHWGATDVEASRPLPGDKLVAEPAGMTTRAITIAASPAAIWPWLAQMGQGRGGAYTYDWIENLLRLGMHSADRILPEFQHPAVGDVVFRTPANEMRIQEIEPERFLVAADPNGAWSWAFVLDPLADGHTRFLSRNRWPAKPGLGTQLVMLVMEPASLVMERKMLLGFKQRAERTAVREESALPHRVTGEHAEPHPERTARR